MNLAEDLRILREVRAEYKNHIIKFVAHLYTHHAKAMAGITSEKLVSIIYSNEPLENIVQILEG